jgi:hypothetical protein
VIAVDGHNDKDRYTQYYATAITTLFRILMC